MREHHDQHPNELLRRVQRYRSIAALAILVLIGTVLIYFGDTENIDWLRNIGLAIIPSGIIAFVTDRVSRTALHEQLDESYRRRGDLEASGLRRIADGLTDMEMLSGFRGQRATDSDRECFVVQTWIPNDESLIRTIQRGLERGYTFHILVGHEESTFIRERYRQMYPRVPEGDVPEEVVKSIRKLYSKLEAAINSGSVRVSTYDGSTGMCIYKIGAYAWLSFYAHGESAVMTPQLCVDANGENTMYELALGHFQRLEKECKPYDFSKFDSE